MSEDMTEGDRQFFRHVGRRIAGVSADCRQRVMKHIDYLAEKAGVAGEHVLRGGSARVHRQMISDAIHNIAAEFSTATDGRLEATIKRSMVLPGWCTFEKASLIAELVCAERPKVCVEIGIYGGRSLVPCAAALRENDEGGVIYGIETWSADVATEHVTNEENDKWWRTQNLTGVKAEFLKFLVAVDLLGWVRLIEAPSADSVGIFQSIDYLHVDGAHSVFNAAEDVVLYFKRLKPGGIIIMDDVNWETTKPAYEILKALCDPITTVKEKETGQDACAILRKRKQVTSSMEIPAS